MCQVPFLVNGDLRLPDSAAIIARCSCKSRRTCSHASRLTVSLCQVPFLVDGDLHLPESAAIIAHYPCQ
jgi:glutathione S-transferase